MRSEPGKSFSAPDTGRNRFPWRKVFIFAGGLVLLIGLGGFYLIQRYGLGANRSVKVISFLRSPQTHPEWTIAAGERCGEAPFIMPTDGFVGFLWGDSFRVGHRHQGIDIFGGSDVNETPVIAAYPGYLTRLPDWKSTVVIRIPDDPLQPGRQIWAYYTHMGDAQGNSLVAEDFPPGTSEVYVEAGRLLGYQGNYSGTPGNPVGVHLHISIVRDNGQGWLLNELDKDNTYDPSPYFGLPLNAAENTSSDPVVCSAN